MDNIVMDKSAIPFFVIVHLSYIVCMYVFLVMAYRRRNERDALAKKLDDLTKKSQLEQDIALATTEQLMTEIASRVSGFILIMPEASNKQNQLRLQLHIIGLQPIQAAECMRQACFIVENVPPDKGGDAKEVDV